MLEYCEKCYGWRVVYQGSVLDPCHCEEEHEEISHYHEADLQEMDELLARAFEALRLED